jgi:hypothetical protein
MSKVRLTQEEFLKRAENKHGDKYSYNNSVFTGVNDKVIITCRLHGDFEQIAHSHLSGNGCSKCSFDKIHNGKVLTTDDFIVKSKIKHGDKYDYSKVRYINNTTKVKIICPIHGEFEQTPQHHKRGNECKKCGNIKTGKAAINNSRGWSLSDWENKLNKTNAKPILYVIRCFNDNETFIKVGITMRSVKKRFCNKTVMPYQFEILLEKTSKADIIFNTEIMIKKLMKDKKYLPLLKFSGCNESFDISATKKMIKLINTNIN